MPTVHAFDIAFLLCLVGVASYPVLLNWWRAVAARTPKPAVVTPAPSAADKPENWVDVLLDMKADLEKTGKNAEAVKLVRQLIWQLIGGGPTP